MNGYGKLHRCTQRNARVVDFCLYLAAALLTIRQLIQRARTRYRWDTRPITKLLKRHLLPGTPSGIDPGHGGHSQESWHLRKRTGPGL